jgi:hypothetical protein
MPSIEISIVQTIYQDPHSCSSPAVLFPHGTKLCLNARRITYELRPAMWKVSSAPGHGLGMEIVYKAL